MTSKSDLVRHPAQSTAQTFSASSLSMKHHHSTLTRSTRRKSKPTKTSSSLSLSLPTTSNSATLKEKRAPCPYAGTTIWATSTSSLTSGRSSSSSSSSSSDGLETAWTSSTTTITPTPGTTSSSIITTTASSITMTSTSSTTSTSTTTPTSIPITTPLHKSANPTLTIALPILLILIIFPGIIIAFLLLLRRFAPETYVSTAPHCPFRRSAAFVMGLWERMSRVRRGNREIRARSRGREKFVCPTTEEKREHRETVVCTEAKGKANVDVEGASSEDSVGAGTKSFDLPPWLWAKTGGGASSSSRSRQDRTSVYTSRPSGDMDRGGVMMKFGMGRRSGEIDIAVREEQLRREALDRLRFDGLVAREREHREGIGLGRVGRRMRAFWGGGGYRDGQLSHGGSAGEGRGDGARGRGLGRGEAEMMEADGTGGSAAEVQQRVSISPPTDPRCLEAYFEQLGRDEGETRYSNFQRGWRGG